MEDYGIDPDRPDSPLSGDDINLALAALMKGLPGIDGAELETLLKDLPMPEPGAKDGISVKEAVEVSFISCYITRCNMVWIAAWCFARDRPGGALSFHCKRAYSTRLRQGEKGRRYVY